MVEIKELLDKLNEEQIKPVLDTEGAVLVIAGAGSGKTRVLTTRIAYLMTEKKVSPYNIMAITFTNKAAKEMKDRLLKIVGEDAVNMWVSTIHSMCVRILRQNIDKLGYDKNFTIYDETDRDKAFKRVFEELHIEDDKLMKSAKNRISSAKNECVLPENYVRANQDYLFADKVAEIYKAYEELLQRANSLDFDDILLKTYLLFVKCPDIADGYSEKFRYIHIDEFQDTNKVQFLIAQRLAIKHGNIFVVGDDDQSIYGWRGAKIENILNFDSVYSGAKIYKLQRNYRSTKKILELANCIIANNVGRREKELWTDNDQGVKIQTYVADDENDEASYVAIQIKNLVSSGEMDYKDVGVFIRVNAISRAFEQEFTKYAIPYRIFGGFRFYERKEIKDVLSYLKVVNNHSDDESFLRAVSSPKRGIGEKTLQELKEYCSANYISLYEGIDRLEETSISGSTKTKLVNFKNLLQAFENYKNNHRVSEMISYVIDTTNFLEQFADKTEENANRIMNIDELKNSAELFEKDNGDVSLSDYLNSVTLSSDTDDINTNNVVTLATIHSVKGLEFPSVFIAGLDEKILPISRSYENDDEMEEERRLMYVAVTRAKKRLCLTRARERYLYGHRDYMVQSRFLKEGAAVLGLAEKRAASVSYGGNFSFNNEEGVSASESTISSGYSSEYAKSMLKEVKPVANKNVDYNGYKAGIKVKHVKFGEGIVISVKGGGDNIIIDVAFKGVGIKSLSAKYAPMEILK